MEYFGVELYDGKSFGNKNCYLVESLPLEDQWVHLSEDIGFIEYSFGEVELSISIDYSTHSGAKLDPNAFFIVEISYTNHDDKSLDSLKVFFSKDLKELKESLNKAVTFVMSLKHLNKDKIKMLKLPDNINYYEEYLNEISRNSD